MQKSVDKSQPLRENLIRSVWKSVVLYAQDNASKSTNQFVRSAVEDLCVEVPSVLFILSVHPHKKMACSRPAEALANDLNANFIHKMNFQARCVALWFQIRLHSFLLVAVAFVRATKYGFLYFFRGMYLPMYLPLLPRESDIGESGIYSCF